MENPPRRRLAVPDDLVARGLVEAKPGSAEGSVRAHRALAECLTDA